MPMSGRPGLGSAIGRPRVFAFRFDRAARFLLLAVGVTPATSRVEVAGGRVRIRYGPWGTQVDQRNIRAVTASGPFQAWKAIGPRVSAADRGLTFGTSTRGGVCIRLRQPVGGLLPRRLLAHPAVTVTVDRPAELIWLLRLSRLNPLAGRMPRPGARTA